MNLSKLTLSEQEELLALMEQKERERVTPLCEQFRPKEIGGSCPDWVRVKGIRGGRGAAAKSHSIVSLLVQMANIKNDFNVACFREVQNSIEESVYRLIQQKIEFLHYTGWLFTKTKIQGPLIDGKRSSFIFRGLKDARSSTNIKSLENYNVYFLEESSTISAESISILLPTLMRQKNPQLYFCLNPNLADDPILTKIWNAGREDALLLTARPGKLDNEWFSDAMVEEMERDKILDYEEYLHVWEGQPYSMGDSAILSATKVVQAMERTIIEPDNSVHLTVGVDVARFGSDRTCIMVRRGNKVIDYKIGKKWDTMRTAKECRMLGKFDPTTIYNVDETGVGGGVVDKLRELNEKHVNGISFGGSPYNKDKYTSIADEMWFGIRDLLDEIDIPNNNDLRAELTARQYSYDNRGRMKIQSKEDFKKNFGNGTSPDLADALILCFYAKAGITIDDKFKQQMRNRRR